MNHGPPASHKPSPQIWDARTSDCLHTFRPAVENAKDMEVRAVMDWVGWGGAWGWCSDWLAPVD